MALAVRIALKYPIMAEAVKFRRGIRYANTAASELGNTSFV
jgi:hypothetical protein